jgi:hypothetical protein
MLAVRSDAEARRDGAALALGLVGRFRLPPVASIVK